MCLKMMQSIYKTRHNWCQLKVNYRNESELDRSLINTENSSLVQHARAVWQRGYCHIPIGKFWSFRNVLLLQHQFDLESTFRFGHCESMKSSDYNNLSTRLVAIFFLLSALCVPQQWFISILKIKTSIDLDGSFRFAINCNFGPTWFKLSIFSPFNSFNATDLRHYCPETTTKNCLKLKSFWHITITKRPQQVTTTKFSHTRWCSHCVTEICDSIFFVFSAFFRFIPGRKQRQLQIQFENNRH